MTRSQAELISIAYTFVADSTTPQSCYEYAAELEKLGMHGAAIPPMRANKWHAIIEALIEAKKLTERNGCVVAVVDDGPKQGLLF